MNRVCVHGPIVPSLKLLSLDLASLPGVQRR